MVYELITRVESFVNNFCVYLPKGFNNPNDSEVFVRFGTNVFPALVKQGETESFQISTALCSELEIPNINKIQLKWEGNTLVIGPYVGMLIDNPLSFRVVLTRISQQLSDVGGVVVYFDSDGINVNEKIVSGYVLAGDDGGRSELKAVTLPLPDVVFKRGHIGDELLLKLKHHYGTRLLNGFQHDKRQMYDLLSNSSMLNHHMPKTSELDSCEVLKRYLVEYKKAIVKPVNGRRGKGILLFVAGRSKVLLYTNDVTSKPTELSLLEFNDYVNELILRDKYIVSTYIDSVRLFNRKVDFRVIVQKRDCNGNWDISCIIPYTGKQGGISGNHQVHGDYIQLTDVFDILGVRFESQRQRIVERIKSLGMEVTSELDNQHCNYVDLGLDIILDNRHKAWLIEVNKYHNHRLPLYLDQKEVYKNVKLKPLKLAILKSGFKVE